MLKDLGAGVSDAILYQSRDEEGTQSPTATLDRGWGSCRDFAVLFAEAARSLGFGAGSSQDISSIISAPGYLVPKELQASAMASPRSLPPVSW